MHSDRRKKVSLAINAIIRGLELDQISFHYDEASLPAAQRRGRSPDAGAAEAHGQPLDA
jgi:hypothetical protein